MTESKYTKELNQAMAEAEAKALDSLGRYKFEMFGYWSSSWIKYNQLGVDMGILKKKKPNPFKALVVTARGMQ